MIFAFSLSNQQDVHFAIDFKNPTTKNIPELHRVHIKETEALSVCFWFKMIKDSSNRWMAAFMFTSVEIADAARQLALSGFSDAEIQDSLEAVVSLAPATNTELEKTALFAARITRAFGLSASSFNTVADTLAVVASNSNTTLEGLGESFKLAAPIAAA